MLFLFVVVLLKSVYWPVASRWVVVDAVVVLVERLVISCCTIWISISRVSDDFSVGVSYPDGSGVRRCSPRCALLRDSLDFFLGALAYLLLELLYCSLG